MCDVTGSKRSSAAHAHVSRNGIKRHKKKKAKTNGQEHTHTHHAFVPSFSSYVFVLDTLQGHRRRRGVLLLNRGERRPSAPLVNLSQGPRHFFPRHHHRPILVLLLVVLLLL